MRIENVVLGRRGKMTARITRAGSEQAGGDGDGEAKQVSTRKSQQWWAEELAVGVFYTASSAELARTVSNTMLLPSP